jgi:hypothetical protein
LAAPVPNWIEALFTPSSLNTPFLVWMNIPRIQRSREPG